MILALFQLIPFIGSMIVSATIAIGASYLAAMLAKKPKQDSPQRSNYPVQTSMKAIPVPKIYGTRRVGGNIIWIGPESGYKQNDIYYYRRSFLIALCEGPAKVLKIWHNRTMRPVGETMPYTITFFDGDGALGYTYGRAPQGQKSGINLKDLTGEEFGEYPNLCCCFFQNWETGILGEIPNFTFEVSTYIPRDFYVGAHYTTGIAGGRPIVWRLRPDGTVNTDWGDEGTWHYSDPVYGSTLTAHKIHPLSDGRVLVAHNSFWIEGPNLAGGGSIVNCTMLTADGEIDTTWGYKGHFRLQGTPNDAAITTPLQLLEDNSGNFYICGQLGYPFEKFDADGNMIFAANPIVSNFQDMCWADDAKSRIIAVNDTINPPGPPVALANCVALDPETGLIDTDWVGNVTGHPGYAWITGGSTTPVTCDAIGRTSDGFAILHSVGNAANNYTLTKLKLDGTGYMTAFGTGGHAEAGWPNYKSNGFAIENDKIWTLAEYTIPAEGAPVGTDNSLRCWNSRGIAIESHDWDSNTTDPISCLTIGGLGLILGTKGPTYTAINNRIEIWNRNTEYVKGFDPAGLSPVSIYSIYAYAPPPGVLDENPSQIIRDMITNTRYGARLTSSVIDDASFIAVEDYCNDNDILISVVLKDGKPVVDWIDYILAHCNGYRWWSGGKLKLGVFKDEDAIGNPITQDDLVVEGDEPPVTITPRKRSETYNLVRIGWTNRDNMYDYSSEPAEDKVDRQWRSEVRTREVELDGYCRISLARKMAWRILFESMYRYNMYAFKVGYRYSLVEVGDVKLLSDGNRITEQKIRILSVREDKDGRTLTIEAIEEAAGLYATTDYDSQEAWTPRVLSADDACDVADAAAAGLTPIYGDSADTSDVNDYAHLEVL